MRRNIFILNWTVNKCSYLIEVLAKLHNTPLNKHNTGNNLIEKNGNTIYYISNICQHHITPEITKTQLKNVTLEGHYTQRYCKITVNMILSKIISLAWGY